MTLCALAVALPLASSPAAAQSLINGGVVSGAISPVGDVDTYTFDANAGEGVQLQMADTGQTTFIPLMWLYSPTGALLQAVNGQDVAAIYLAAPSTGTYTLEVSDWTQNGTGDYDIHYTRAPGANEHGALINGGSVSGTIDLGDLDSYTFDVQAGEFIQLQMADIGQTAFIPLMRLYSPTGAFLQAANDQDVAAIFLAAQSTGTYTLVVSGWIPSGTGDYAIHYTRAPGANEHGALINGGFVSGTIDLGDLDSYTFDVQAGESIQLQMADIGQTAFIPLMRLYSPSGAFLQAANGQEVAAISLAAQSTGTYTLVVSDWIQSGTGNYEIHFTHRPGANEGGALINGGFVSGTIDLGDLDSYTFDAQAGESVQLQVADLGQTTFIPLMRLYSPTGALLQAANGQDVAAIYLPAQSTGIYTLVVSAWIVSGTGDYAIHYTRAPGANEGGKLVHGDLVSGTIELGDLDSFTFNAYLGEDIELQMTEVNGTSLYPLMRLYGPSGTFLQAANGANVATIAHTAPATGTYTVVLSDWTLDGTGDYGLSLSRGVSTYCTAGTTASGCTSQMSAYGDPSASAPSGFLVRATGGEGNMIGIFFFGTSGQTAIPWGSSSSFLCVLPPIERTPAAHGGGTNGSCDAAASLDFNNLITLDPAVAPPVGSLVQFQYWFRDPANPSNQGSSMSDALEFTLQP
jgi:hypothetical protein